MKQSRPSLFSALKPQPKETAAPPSEPAKTASPGPSSTSYTPPSREGKKAVTGHFAPEVSKQLKMLALEEDSTIQSLLAEALNDLFEKRGKSPIA